MNKGLLIALTGVLMGVQAGVAHAVNPDNGPGCGLGKLAWADYKTPKNIAPQVMMATTNGTFGKVMAGQQTNVFVAGAFESLSEDMARGGGEHLATLATLMGVPSEQQSTFFALAQQQYGALVGAGELSSVAVVKALQEAMKEQPVLAQASGIR